MTTEKDGINYPESFDKQQREDFKSLTKLQREVILNCREGMLKSEAYFYAESTKAKDLNSAAAQFSRQLKNVNFKRMYDSVTTTSYSDAMDMRKYVSDALKGIIDADSYIVPPEELQAGDKVKTPVKTSDRTAAIKQFSEHHDLANSRYISQPVDLEGLTPLEALDELAVKYAANKCSDATVRMLVTIYKAKVDLKNDIEMQERVENIEQMLEDARRVK